MQIILDSNVNVREEQFGDLGGLLYRDDLYELNKTGYKIVEYLDETDGASLDEVADHISERFDTDHRTAERDVQEFVQRMEEFGIVKVKNA